MANVYDLLESIADGKKLSDLETALLDMAAGSNLAAVVAALAGVANLDITLSALRDALAGSGTGAKTLSQLYTALTGTLTTQLTGSITGKVVSATQTRPDNTTAYSANQVIGENPATNLTFENVLSNSGGTFVILGARLEIDVSAVPAGMTSFRLHIYNAAPAAIADGAAYNLLADDRAKYMGYITINSVVDLGATVWGQEDNVNFTGKLATGATSLYGILETIGAFTPAALAVKKVYLNVAGV